MDEETLLRVKNEIPCRDTQINQLTTSLDPKFPTVPALVLYGQEATGKTLVISKLVSHLGTPSVIVDSRECITGRHLLEHTVATCRSTLEEADYGPFDHIDSRCESLSSLVVQLSLLLERCPRFYLVFDGVDKQREASSTLLSALARLGDLIPGLTTIFIVAYPFPLLFHRAGIPHIEFPPYDKASSLAIIGRRPLSILTADLLAEASEQRQKNAAEDDLWLWQRYCGIVWDALGRGAARDLVQFHRLCERLWPAFVQPIREGSVEPRELSKLVNRTRRLFQSEEALKESIVPITSSTTVEERKRALKNVQDLSYYSKYLLIAAYLASHNPPRTDAIFFMKMHETKKRKSRKSVASATAHPSAATRPMKHRKVQRRLLGAQPFVLERLLAIFHAIVPDHAPSGTADILTQVATLAGLRLLIKLVSSADVTDANTKWKVNVGWEYVLGLARALRFEVEDFLVD